MKDQRARDDIARLQEGFNGLGRNTPSLMILYCPKCKHETLQFPDATPLMHSYTFGKGTINSLMDDTEAKNCYRCLTCGKLIYHGSKEVCEIVSEKKKK